MTELLNILANQRWKDREWLHKTGRPSTEIRSGIRPLSLVLIESIR